MKAKKLLRRQRFVRLAVPAKVKRSCRFLWEGVQIEAAVASLELELGTTVTPLVQSTGARADRALKLLTDLLAWYVGGAAVGGEFSPWSMNFLLIIASAGPEVRPGSRSDILSNEEKRRRIVEVIVKRECHTRFDPLPRATKTIAFLLLQLEARSLLVNTSILRYLWGRQGRNRRRQAEGTTAGTCVCGGRICDRCLPCLIRRLYSRARTRISWYDGGPGGHRSITLPRMIVGTATGSMLAALCRIPRIGNCSCGGGSDRAQQEGRAVSRTDGSHGRDPFDGHGFLRPKDGTSAVVAIFAATIFVGASSTDQPSGCQG